jgi:hypothetical protein
MRPLGMDSFYLYFTTFWPKWMAVVSAFALFAVEPMARAYWPWLFAHLAAGWARQNGKHSKIKCNFSRWCGRWDSNPHDVAIEGF